MEEEFHFSVTLAVFGDKGVGKSSLIKSMLRHRLKATVLRHEVSGPVSYHRASYNHNGVIFLIDIIEIPGENAYKDSLAKFVARGASYCIFMYDTSDENSLEGCRAWIEAVNTADAYVVGNKNDVKGDQKITIEQGWNMANAYGLRAGDVCCKLDAPDGVDMVMEAFLSHVCEKVPNPPEPSLLMGVNVSVGPKVLADAHYSKALFGSGN